MNLTLFIGSLKPGGAERQALVLANQLATVDVDVTIVTIFRDNQLAWIDNGAFDHVRKAAIFSRRPGNKIFTLLYLMIAPLALRQMLRKEKADVVYSMLYLSNLIAKLATLGRGAPGLIWGVRASQLPSSWKRFVPFNLCRLLSGRVPVVIANSEAGLQFHLARGFRFQSSFVIRNGIDIELFGYDQAGRDALRSNWNVGDHEILIGAVGRYDEVKGYNHLVDAAAALAADRTGVRFVCVGPNISAPDSPLREMIHRRGLDPFFVLEDLRKDMSAVYSSFDYLVSSSLGEGFPNVVAEAMACGTPCIVTDVGDSRFIVGQLGIVVPPGDSRALLSGISEALEKPIRRSSQCRERIRSEFSVEKMGELTLAVIRDRFGKI